MRAKCAEAATPKRSAQTFWPFQPCGLCNLSIHPLCLCFCYLLISFVHLMNLFHDVFNIITNMPSRCSAKRMTSDTGSVPGERMKINGVVLTLAPRSRKHVTNVAKNLYQALCQSLGPIVAQDVLRLPMSSLHKLLQYNFIMLFLASAHA